MSILWSSFPNLHSIILGEDNLLENMTAILYLSSFILSCIYILKYQLIYKSYLAIPLISIACFLDEISFGERMLNFQPLKTKNGFKLDGFHDLPDLLVSYISRHLAVAKIALSSN